MSKTDNNNNNHLPLCILRFVDAYSMNNMMCLFTDKHYFFLFYYHNIFLFYFVNSSLTTSDHISTEATLFHRNGTVH